MQAYRVIRTFQWNGWKFAPGPNCRCPCANDTKGSPDCTAVTATLCECRITSCNCSCGIDPSVYGGTIWLVEEGHPRLAAMLRQRFMVYDSSLNPATLMEQEEYSRLLTPPKSLAVSSGGKK